MDRKTAQKRAEALVQQMTVQEKVDQLRSYAPAVERLGIPAYNWWNEALHGVARAGVATVFPQAIGLAASFDTELVHAIGDVISTEGRAKYNAYSAHGDRGGYKGLTFWAPNINIFRDPRWGRGHETYGEDPYLTAQIGTAFVTGIQSIDDDGYMRAAACAKHFFAHSGPEGERHSFDAKVTPKDLAETYLPAFEALVTDAKVEIVMGAYNRVNGVPCCANPPYMQGLLREKWGFEGHFVSDCLALKNFHKEHHVTKNDMESAALAIQAGCDLNCGDVYRDGLMDAYNAGMVSEETITRAAVHLFTTRMMLGLFDECAYDTIPYDVVGCKEHLALSEKAARESFVLLKNDGILPLQKEKIKTLGIIGPNANSRLSLIGNYHGTASEYVTIQQGLMDYLGDDVRIYTAVGCGLNGEVSYEYFSEAEIVAEQSDVVILCLGLDETLQGEAGDAGNSDASGDVSALSLPQSQIRLMETVAKANKPVVLCMLTGSAVELEYATQHFSAILQCWYPGAQGGRAVARTLFGESEPSGKLPVTFYRADTVLPPVGDYSMKNRTYRYVENLPLYPFGFGLTYGKMEMRSAVMDADGTEVTACVFNTSDRATDEVLQVYIRKDDSVNDSLHPSLCAFARVHCAPKEEKKVIVRIPERAWTVVDENGDRHVEGNRFTLFVGFSQPDARSVELMERMPIQINYVRKTAL